ncbi:conidial yellow pigment biosynthesis polyketide synthase, partial [Penicillium argentinense]
LAETESNSEFSSFHARGLSESDVKGFIESFILDQALPKPQWPYVTIVWPSFVTISGPTSSVTRFKNHLKDAHNVSYLDSYSFEPFHAPHIHHSTCAQRFLDLDLLSHRDGIQPALRSSVLSVRDGRPYHADSLKDFYILIITDLLYSRQNLYSAFEHQKRMILSETESCGTLVFGPIDLHDPLRVELGRCLPLKPTDFADWRQQISASFQSHGRKRSDNIAIVGMSGRFPGAQNMKEFWKVLYEGLDMHREVPSDRFDAQSHCDVSGKGRNKSHTPFGCFIDNAGLFDSRFFNMSPREATQTDPMQRLALTTAYEALEMAGYVPNRTPSTQLDRIGTFYGQTSDDWRETNAAQDIDTYFITGGVRAFGPGRINYHFGFSGPSFNVDTACSSSMAAIHAACNALWLQDCDTAIAGGLNVMTNPDIFSGLSKGQFLSKTGACQTFDNDADGYCRGDAVATLVLKRLLDAEADHDNVLGVIRSVATNHSADAISITHPHAETQEILYRRVLAQAGIDSEDVSYVEMHGTGTQAGDSTEMRSVTNVFAPATSSRPSDKKLYVGSVKANVGHGEGSSGVTAVVKTLLMMRHNLIPPHVGIKKELNKTFPDLAARNVHIARQPVSWESDTSNIRNAFVNNFSAAGGNTAVLITDSQPRRLVGSDPRKTHVIAVSARALSSLKSNLNNLLEFLTKNPDVSLASLSYTTTARRIQHNYRFSVAASDITTVKSVLTRTAQADVLPVSQLPKLIMTFTGQGSMYAAIGADLFATCSIYRESLLEYDSIAVSCGFPSIRALVDGSEDRPVADLSPVLLQVAQISIQMALTRLWHSLGVVPDVVFGHSLGEYAALFASGILSAADTIYLVGCRAQLMETHCAAGTHAMLAVQGDFSLHQDLISAAPVQVACINSSKEYVLSGLTADIDRIQCQSQELGLGTTRLSVPYAFHSCQVDPIIAPFAQICSSVTFGKPRCEVVSSLLGRTLGQSTIDADYLCRHARQTVNFEQAISMGISNKTIDEKSIFLEIGPHPVCNAFLKSILGHSITTCTSLQRNRASWDTIASTASELSSKGANIDWSEYHREFENSLELLELPSYGWTLSNYWIDYKHSWCLTKGANPAAIEQVQTLDSLSTTSVHRVLKEQFDRRGNFIIAETDLARPDIQSVLSGHLVNDVALCPSSLYGDIGITVGRYMWRKMFPELQDDPIPCTNVRDMTIPKTLIARDAAPLVLKIDAKASDSKQSIRFTLSTQDGEHAHFNVEFGKDSEWVEEWKRTGFLVESRIQSLREQVNSGTVHLLRQEVAYKLFSSFVNYGKTFRGIKKVYLDAKHWEATADIVLETPGVDHSFNVPPYWIDSIGHLSGFIMNVHLDDSEAKNVFVSHGWESLRLARTLIPGKVYQTYVRMIEKSGTNTVSGDVYCLEESTVIALFGGVTFKRISRAILDQVLPRPRSIASRPVNNVEKPIIQLDKGSPIGDAPPLVPHVKVNGPSLLSQVLDIVSEECGVEQNELADAISFADFGVDSLMQLAISSRLREELNLEISSSLFIDNPTVGSLKAFIQTLDNRELFEDTTDSMSTMATSQYNDNPSPVSIDTDDTTLFTNYHSNWRGHFSGVEVGPALSVVEEPSDPVSHSVSLPLNTTRHATSYLLQGNPRTATVRLFLFPDGGGSATSYTHIPDLSSDVVIYGLNSPFMTTPEEYTCGVVGIAQYFIQEIRRRQPQGPYNIGHTDSSIKGWSAGGVIAFEGAQQLIRSGEVVERLILLDAPCPLTIEPLPSSLHQTPRRWRSKKTPPWLLPHFQASINALSTYSARALNPAKAPSTFLIWCEHGVCKDPTDPRPDPYPYGHAQFLLENKNDLGPQLWDALLGLQNIEISHIPGNHFTMMKAP